MNINIFLHVLVKLHWMKKQHILIYVHTLNKVGEIIDNNYYIFNNKIYFVICHLHMQELQINNFQKEYSIVNNTINLV